MKLVYTIATLLLMLQAGATIRYVRVGASGGTGLTWATAYNNLETALNAAVAGDQVWVSAGTYQPATSGSFTIKPGVQVFGGFPTTGNPVMADTSWKVNKTYLQKASANSSIVAMSGVNTATILNGFYIQNGNAVDGAGLYMTGSGATGAAPTIQNIVFDKCVATTHGGGIQVINASPLLINLIFQNCKAVYGGGISTEDAAPDVRRCAFDKDSATTDGGSIYYNGTPVSGQHGVFTDVVVYNGWAGRSAGGASLQGDGAAPKFINCTFVNNYSGQSINTTGGAIYTYSSTTTNPPSPAITNCLFFGNTNSAGVLDVGAFRATNTVTYSYFSTATTGQNGNVLSSTTPPFTNLSSPKGADGIWLTADDGFVPSICSGRMVVDKGFNSAITYTVDATYLPRKVDVGLVADGGSGTAPIVDMGAYESQITATQLQAAGTIQGNDTIPYPQEQAIDTIKSVNSPISGATIQWQSKTSSGVWQAATGTNTGLAYIFTAPITQTTRFRRAVFATIYCDTLYSNEMEMYVYDPFLPVNDIGVITGRISSRTNAAISGVKISIIRLGQNTSGSPAGYEYPNVSTGSDGTFTKTGIYYGPNNRSVDSFLVKPFLAGHRIITIVNGDTVESVKVKLQKGSARPDSVRFTDITVYSVQGATYQRCLGCIDASGIPISGYKTCPLDSVKIIRGNNDDSVLTYLSGDSAFYGVSIINAGTYLLTPKYKNHLFSPSSLLLPVTSNLNNQNFEDTTRYSISGKLTAGCGDSIGSAVLLFNGIVRDRNGNVQPSCFRKKVTTTTDGSYSISLPAGKYKVQVDGFTSDFASNDVRYIGADVLKTFFNDATPADSLTRDISIANAVLNLQYTRPPVLVVTKGLDTFCSPGTGRGYALMQQGIRDSFTVKIYQGKPTVLNGIVAAGCLLKDTSKMVDVFTTIQATDLTSEQLSFKNSDTGIVVKLLPGSPNTAGDFTKSLNIQYIDKYNRVAKDLKDNTGILYKVGVTGAKADAGNSFTTVSPQIPLLVLHDPPGDQSFSQWMSTESRESALRMYAQESGSAKAWREVKLGTEQEIEVFGVGTEFKFWGKINNAITVAAANNTANELILSSSTSTTYNTSSNPVINGANGDLYIGTALNLVYAGSDEVSYTNCQLTKKRRLIIANDGFAPGTDYIYSEYQIRNNIIPSLIELADGNTDSTNYYIMQKKIWEQLLENNAANKRRATFDKNISWGGAGGAFTQTTTSGVSKTSTIEFSLSIKNSLAAELGFEIAGSGVTDGVDINVKMETGQSNTTNISHQTQTSYTFLDQNVGDIFNVNVKKDPVYSTPVFELVGGRTSCPVEPGSYPRDQFEIYAPVPVQRNVPAGGTATFELRLQNTNATEARYYYLTFEQVSNLFGAKVQVNNVDYTTPQYFVIPAASEVSVSVNVLRPVNSTVYGFEGLQFSINDSCYRISKTTSISAFFQSPCSNIAIGYPENNWVLAGTGSNTLPVLVKNYTIANLSSIRVEYAKVGTSSWNTAFTRSAAQLNPDSTTIFWSVQSVPDGAYKIRVALNCASGTTYSESIAGVMDRKAPALFGKPEPTDDKYVNGDQVSFTYTEKLNTDSLNDGRITMLRLSNNQPVPITVSGYDNRIMITPNSPITGFTNDTMRVIVSAMSDVYGNVKARPDTIFFAIGNSPVDTSNTALNLAIINRVLYKNSDSTMYIKFTLPVNATYDRRINYFVSGTARLGIDYTLADSTPANYSDFNGIIGSASIRRNNRFGYLKIKAISSNLLDSNKTIIINLNEGGDYTLGANTYATGIITSEDSVYNYTFTGNGNFDVKANWQNGIMPLTTIKAGKTVNINPATGGKCILNVPVTIKPGATLNIKANKELLIPGNLKLN